jgi:hypothetical protein
LEIISPSNKASLNLIQDYQSHRHRLRFQGVNIVEIDPTRSIMRMYKHELTMLPYHIAVYLPTGWPYIISSSLREPLHRFALPLRQQVVAVETQAAYDDAYFHGMITSQMLDEHGYSPEALPFPTLLGEEQRRELNEAVVTWKAELARLAQAG